MSTENYDAVAYNDLKKMASQRGLDSKGTKDELIARLTEADGGTVPPEGGTGTPPKIEDETPRDMVEEEAPSPVRATSDLDKKYMTKAMLTKKALESQPKVMVFIPFEAGENAAEAAKIKLPVNINGYQFDIPRGVAVNVPQQVAEMIRERLESEGKAGRSARIDASEDRQIALS